MLKYLFLVISLMFNYAMAQNFTGPTTLSDATLDDVTIVGPGVLGEMKLDNLTVTGPLDFKKLLVQNVMTVIGPVKGELLRAAKVDITGPLSLEKARIESLTVLGPVTAKEITVEDTTHITGNANLRDSKLNNLIVKGNKLTIINTSAQSITIEPSKTKKQTLVVEHGSELGDITFMSGTGHITIDHSSKIGKVTGATVSKK